MRNFKKLLVVCFAVFALPASAENFSGTVSMSNATFGGGTAGMPFDAKFKLSSNPSVVVVTTHHNLARQFLIMAQALSSPITEVIAAEDEPGIMELQRLYVSDPSANGTANRVLNVLMLTTGLPDHWSGVTMGDGGTFLIVSPEQAAVVANAIFTHRPITYKKGCIPVFSQSVNQMQITCGVATFVKLEN